MFTTESFYNGRIVLHAGDSRDVAKTLPSNSLDSLVSDTPYALESVVKRFGADDAAPVIPGKTGVYARSSGGFMGQKWDTGDVAHDPAFWREWYRVLKPGAYIAVFGGTRTFHRLAGAVEAAGFEIRDTILNVIDPASPVIAFMESLSEEQLRLFVRCMDDAQFGGLFAWMYGTGFPKSHNLSKAIDGQLFQRWLDDDPTFRREVYREEMQATNRHRNPKKRAEAKDAVEARWRAQGGFAREVVGENANHRPVSGVEYEGVYSGANTGAAMISRAATGEAFQWEGWGTALKPAFEPICVARKPLSEETIAANVLRWRTGALNIDGCRVAGESTRRNNTAEMGYHGGNLPAEYQTGSDSGRWPANVVTDGSEVVADMFPDTTSGGAPTAGDRNSESTYGEWGERSLTNHGRNAGSASRFFYSAKASKADRAGSKHPTVKPVALKQWLVRLVTPPGGITADPFAGTGTLGEAAVREGMRCIMVEREESYRVDIRRRMAMVFMGPEERARALADVEPIEATPLWKVAPASPEGQPEARLTNGTTSEAAPEPAPRAAPVASGPDPLALLRKLRQAAGRPGPIPKLTQEVVGGES